MRTRRAVTAALTSSLLALSLGLVVAGAPSASAAPDDLVLTLLHNNDGESQIPAAADGGGAAQFATIVDQLRAASATQPGDFPGDAGAVGEVLISSGDNFLAGANFSASYNLPPGQQWYEARLLELLGYDAVTVGNHDFDFGPEGLARFIGDTPPPIPFVTANLDFSAEPELQALVDANRLAPTTTVDVGGVPVGIIGLTTPELRSISSPRNVVIDPSLADAVTTQVDVLTTAGVDVIILSSHLQGIDSELALISQISGVDVVIAGGGDELLWDASDLPLLAGEAGTTPFDSYPIEAPDADGGPLVPVVTTPGNFRYVGRLQLRFNAAGELQQVGGDSGLVPVVPGTTPHPTVQTDVVDPVLAATAALDANVIAETEVELDGRNIGGLPVRARETNLGNLTADSLLFTAEQRAAEFGQNAPVVSLQNGGGIRLASATIPPGPITERDTFDIYPFANFVSIVPDVTPAQLKTLLEHSVGTSPTPNGRFGQWGGIRFVYDIAGTAQTVTVDPSTGDSVVATPGSRIVDVWLLDTDNTNGTQLIADGAPMPGAPSINLATIDFTARNGDAYPFTPLADFVSVGISYQQGLAEYLTSTATAIAVPADSTALAGLGGVVTDARYPVTLGSTTPSNRIVCTGATCPQPTDASAGYHPLVPVRAADTRDGTGVAAGPVSAGAVLEVPMAGLFGVPTDATGVIVNATAANGQAPGYLSVFPCGTSPYASSVNHESAPVANLVSVGLGTGGSICVLSFATVDVVVDVSGWYKEGVALTPTTPTRIADTRDGTGGVAVAPVAGGAELVVPVPEAVGVPSSASAVAVTLTLTNTSGDGFATIYPCGSDPYVSNVNYVVGQIVPNAAVVGIGEGRAVCVGTSDAADVIVDLTGYVGVPGGVELTPVVPERVADTRDGVGGVTVAKVPAGGVLEVQAVPASEAALVAGVVINLTGTNADADGFLTAQACGTSPYASNVNLVAGDGKASASAAFSPVDDTGKVCISSFSTTDVVVDITTVVGRL